VSHYFTLFGICICIHLAALSEGAAEHAPVGYTWGTCNVDAQLWSERGLCSVSCCL